MVAHHKIMPLSPLPGKNFQDLEKVKSLIQERVSYIGEIDKEIKLKQQEKSMIKKEINNLQNVGRGLLMIAPRKEKVEE